VINERDLSQERRWLYEERARAAINNLQKRNIEAQYATSRAEALSSVLQMIPGSAVVARGDSVTLDQLGVIHELKKRGQNRIIDPLERDSSGFYVVGESHERRRMAREAFLSDIFLAGTNAITLDGKLVNIDGWGNRVSAMIFGPDKVIIVAGANKIVKDVDEALSRVREVCAPMNARRHYLKHYRDEFADLPCVRTGRCADCNHDWRICRYLVIIEGASIREKGRFNVIIVGEELGI